LKETLQFVVEHGYLVLFLWVLVEQLGLPLPSVPILLAAGALSGTGHMSLAASLFLALLAALISDIIWFEFGKAKGASVLNTLCRISLEPDSCVRRTEQIYEKSGARALLVSKFVPGLNTAAPPVAGMFGMNFWRFLLFDALGCLLWASTFIGLGWIFADQLEDVALNAERLGTWLLVLLVGALAAYVAKKWWERKKFLKTLAEDRITPEELAEKLNSHEPVAIIDLRHPLDVLPDPRMLPGAIRMTAEELEARNEEIPRDREIILYCT
jgi:membrane protein DedA with SNARE-associated domain